LHPKSDRPGKNLTGCRLRVVRVLVVHVVFAREDDWQLPELCEVHLLVQDALIERAFPEEAHGHALIAQIFRCVRGPGRQAGAAAHNRVGAEISRLRVGDVHRAALAFAVARFLAEKLRKHAIGGGALRQAVPVTAMRARNLVVAIQQLTDADGNRFFADVEMGESRHQRSRIQIVDPLFEQANRDHLSVHVQQILERNGPDSAAGCLLVGGHTHFCTPAMRASTSKTVAKSRFARPMPRAAVSISLPMAVVGSGTSSCRPISRASCMSFCIMLTSNHASSGMLRTKGPRYCTIGEAMTLWVSTPTPT